MAGHSPDLSAPWAWMYGPASLCEPCNHYWLTDVVRLVKLADGRLTNRCPDHVTDGDVIAVVPAPPRKQQAYRPGALAVFLAEQPAGGGHLTPTAIKALMEDERHAAEHAEYLRRRDRERAVAEGRMHRLAQLAAEDRSPRGAFGRFLDALRITG